MVTEILSWSCLVLSLYILLLEVQYIQIALKKAKTASVV